MDDFIRTDKDLSKFDYGDVIEKVEEEDYGKKMTDELSAAVEDVMNMDYDQFQTEEGARALQRAVEAAEEAPEANAYDDIIRMSRTGELLEGYGEQVREIDLDDTKDLPDYSDLGIDLDDIELEI